MAKRDNEGQAKIETYTMGRIALDNHSLIKAGTKRHEGGNMRSP